MLSNRLKNKVAVVTGFDGLSPPVINFASANAHVALAGSPALAHCAGKGGVLAMTRQLAMEGAPHGIRANTISPALVVTPPRNRCSTACPDSRTK